VRGVLAVLRAPGSARLFAASMIARTPATALALVFVLRTKELTGSFAAAGVAAGLYALANAACGPALGRLADRRGYAAVLAPAAVLSALALAAFAALPDGAPLAAVLACAAATGAAMPPVGPCLRALWPCLLPEGLTHAAFALESAVLEVTYIAGPVLIAGAIGAWSTVAAALTSAVLLLAGTLVFAAAQPVRTHRPQAAIRAGSPLRAAGVRTLAVVYVLVGVAFGAVEVGVPATADAAGSPHAAGLLLGVWGLGSLLGGLAAARARPPADRVKRLCILLALLAAGHLLLALPAGLLGLGGLLLLAGAAIAPAFGTAYGLVDGVAPAGSVTETFTWLSTGIALGLATGSAAGGALADGPGTATAFVLGGAACAAAAIYAARRRTAMIAAV
jgi:predicted MFS family arabinose efflux permease